MAAALRMRPNPEAVPRYTPGPGWVEEAGALRRPGAHAFRKAVFARDGACVITGTPVGLRVPTAYGYRALVQAAHIKPVRMFPEGDPAANELDNGLALRADLHTAFDLGLWTVDSAGFCDWRPNSLLHRLLPCSKLRLTPRQKRYMAGHYKWATGTWED